MIMMMMCTELSVIFTFHTLAIDASPQSGINQFCTQSEMFDVCGENMQCEKIGEIALCKCNPGYAPLGKLCKGLILF